MALAKPVKSSGSTKLVRKANDINLKANGAGYATKDKNGNVTYYKSGSDAPGYYDDNSVSRANMSKGTPMFTKDSSGKIITSTNLAPTGKIDLPPPPVTTDPGNLVVANNQGLTSPSTGLTSDAKGMLTVNPTQPPQDKYQGLFDLFNASQTALQGLEADRTTGADIQRKLERETGIKDIRQQVNDYSAQLNTIVANRDANLLRVEGQGRGIPDVIIGGQQAQINKEAAIQALPVQAQLSAAQGNLELAQSHIATWGKILMDDANNAYTYKKDLLSSARDFATGIELKRIADLDAANERKYKETQEFNKAKTDALSNALAQGAPASIYNAIKNASTTEQVIIAAGAYNGDVLDRQYKLEQLNALRAKSTGETVGGLVKVTPKEIQDVNDAAIAKASLVKLADSMIESIKKGGTKLLWGKEAGARDSAKTNLLLAMKNLEKTGALDKGTIDVLSGTIPDNTWFATEAAQIAALEGLRDTVAGKVDEYIGSYRGTTAETDPRTKRIYSTETPAISVQKAISLQLLDDAEANAFDSVWNSI